MINMTNEFRQCVYCQKLFKKSVNRFNIRSVELYWCLRSKHPWLILLLITISMVFVFLDAVPLLWSQVLPGPSFPVWPVPVLFCPFGRQTLIKCCWTFILLHSIYLGKVFAWFDILTNQTRRKNLNIERDKNKAT